MSDINTDISDFHNIHNFLMNNVIVEDKSLSEWQDAFAIDLEEGYDFVTLQQKLCDVANKLQICGRFYNQFKTTNLYIEDMEEEKLHTARAEVVATSPRGSGRKNEMITKGNVVSEFAGKKRASQILTNFFQEEFKRLQKLYDVLNLQAMAIMAENKTLSHLYNSR